MKLLYLSSHEVEAYDELLLLHELNVEVFVLGAKPGRLRPRLDFLLNTQPDFLSPQERARADQMLFDGHGLEKWLVDKFDAVIVISRNDWLIDFWEIFKHKKIFFRLNGQSDEGTQIRLEPFVRQGMEVIGYSPHENKKFTRFPVRHTIRLYKDPNEWREWMGNEMSVMTSCQEIERGDECCNPTAYRKTLQDFPHALYGGGNERFLAEGCRQKSGMLFSQGALLDYEALKQKFREHRVYFYVGTQPASYTLNFIEAWVTGIPVVALGPRFKTYEVCDLIDNGVNGFYSNEFDELRGFIRLLLQDTAYARRVGEEGRKKAVEIFGKSNIKRQWENFLSRYV